MDFLSYTVDKRGQKMPTKKTVVQTTTTTTTSSKSAGFAAAAANTESRVTTNLRRHECWLIRALRWIFITMPTAIWNWIKSIDLNGLANLVMLLLIIILFLILIGQILNIRCDSRAAIKRAAPEIVVASDNVSVTDKSAVVITPTSTPITLPLKKFDESVKVSATTTAPAQKKAAAVQYVQIGNDLIIDGSNVGRGLAPLTKINGNLILQNMRNYTLPCDVKVNGNLIVRNVRMLKFCGRFTVNGNIYVSSDSSFGPIPKNASIRGQIIM